MIIRILNINTRINFNIRINPRIIFSGIKLKIDYLLFKRFSNISLKLSEIKKIS